MSDRRKRSRKGKVVNLEEKASKLLKQVADKEFNNELEKEMNNLSNYIYKTAGATTGVSDVKLADLQRWLRNPVQSLAELRRLSRYYYVKEGIITDTYDIFKTLPILNYSVYWEEILNPTKYQNYQKKIRQFLKSINPKQLARDTIFSCVQDGACVWYLRGGKYIEFLDLNHLEIDTMVDGKWQVKFNMETLEPVGNNDIQLKKAIGFAPEEVTMAKWTKYNNDKENNRLVDLDMKKTHVVKLRGDRLTPLGTPYAVGAMSAILHRELLESTEKALAQRINNQIIIQKIGMIGSKDSSKPPTKEMLRNYHNALKAILEANISNRSYDSVGTAPLTVPEWVDIKELEIKMTLFPKETYDRIDRQIYQKLGYSPVLNMGGVSGGQSFGGGTINVEKIFSIIFFVLEQVEDGINDYLSHVVSSDNFNPQLKYGRSTMLDKDTHVKHNKDLYLQGRGSLKYWVESAGHDFEHYIAQARYENEVLKLDEILSVHETSFNKSSSGNENSGRPEKDLKDNTDESVRSKGNGANESPRPSD